MKKYVRVIVIAVVGFLLVLGALKMFNIPSDSDYISYERIVKNVERKNQNIYFEFVNDYKDESNKTPNIYSFTEYSEVKADYVYDNIKVGDTIKVTVENNSGNFKYKLLQKVEKNGTMIFDSIEHYQNHNRNLRLIFIPAIIIISLFLIILSFIDLEKNNSVEAFIIRYPKWILSLFIFSILIGAVVPIMFTIVFLTGKMHFDLYQYSFIFYLFLAVGILGIISFFSTYIKYDSNDYYIHQMFKKTKKIGKKAISKVLFDKTFGRKNKSGLYDKDNIRIMKLNLELHYYFSKDYFCQSLVKNGVEFLNLIKDENGEDKEEKIAIF